MSEMGKEGVANDDLTSRAPFPGPAEWPTTSPLQRSTSRQTQSHEAPTRAGQVAAYMGARRPAAKAARDDVLHVGLVDRPGVHLEPLPAVCAGQAVLPHDAADPAPADGDARPPGRRLYLARAVPALAGDVGRGPAGAAGRAASACSSTSTSRRR